jgi:hypothetical protein
VPTVIAVKCFRELENEVKKRGGNAVIDCKESNSPESRGILFADVDPAKNNIKDDTD